MPLGHLGLNVPDLAVAKRYYDALMPALDYEPFLDDPDQFAYRPAAAKVGTYLFFYPTRVDGAYDDRRSGLQHLAFIVRTRAAVRDAASLAESLGSPIVHAPQHWPQYPPPYFAAFWHDPHGFLLEAVCHHDRA